MEAKDGLEIKIALGNYRMFFTPGTEDYFHRAYKHHQVQAKPRSQKSVEGVAAPESESAPPPAPDSEPVPAPAPIAPASAPDSESAPAPAPDSESAPAPVAPAAEVQENHESADVDAGVDAGAEAGTETGAEPSTVVPESAATTAE